MIDAVVTLGSQEIECKGHIEGQTYMGLLSAPITEKEFSEFWNEYEVAVNNVMLQEVDILESRMARYQFNISVCGTSFLGDSADLQIYPSSKAISFQIPSHVHINSR